MFFILSSSSKKNSGLTVLWNPRFFSNDTSLLYPFLGILPAGGGVKTDEYDHGSVCAVSGILTQPGDEERKKYNGGLNEDKVSYQIWTFKDAPSF